MRLYPRLHLITGKKRGLGEAYKRGISQAMTTFHPDLILQMDADFQHDPSLLPQFIRLCNQGFDLVIGSRFARGTDIKDFPWHRRLISITGTRLVRWFSGIPPVTDCTSGYRCIKARLISRCQFGPYSTRGYSFQSWFLCELLRNGARYTEVPLPFPARQNGQSKLTFWDKVEFLLCLFYLGHWRPASDRDTALTPEETACVLAEVPRKVGPPAEE